MIVRWLPAARADLEKAINFIAAENPGAALGQLDEIERQSDDLARFPELGRPGRNPRTRELVIGRTPFILIYRLRTSAGPVEILRLLHGAQRWP